MKLSKLLLFAALISAFSACKKAKIEKEHPNIVWITSEDNSKHYMDMFDEHGVPTPNIASLAENGVVFTHAFSNAAVCSAARSTLISGCYGPRMASHYHRKLEKVPMPQGIEMYPAYLKAAGYYTGNNNKEDYNIIKSDSVWDESSKKAHWRNRKPGQPFFYVQNIGTTHEGCLHFSKEDFETKKTETDPDKCFVQPNHPNTKLMKYTNAWYRDKIMEMDRQVGDILAELKKDSLLENTFVFYYGDHGGVLPGSKGYLFETGLHVPLVVHIPKKYEHLVNIKPGTKNDGFVSFVDFGATILNLAGVEIPKGIDGKPFLGKNISEEELNNRDETFSYADRFDEKYDMVRAIRKGKYKYIRHFEPFNYDGLMNNYRYKQLAYQQWAQMHEDKKLNEIQDQFFHTKPAEALYDVEADPFETVNLINNENYKTTLLEMRERLTNKLKSMPDLSFYPEYYLIKNAFDNPVAFGQKNKAQINKYIDIANLELLPFNEAKSQLSDLLKSDDWLSRYWALIVCTKFENEAKEFAALIKNIAQEDKELMNRVRAAEFLGMTGIENPSKVMTHALYTSKDSNEALLILNSIVLMKDGSHKYKFDIQLDQIPTTTQENKMVQQRLKYLNIIS
ncbi:sulfatase family protein [Saccharicrinis fermentans]|uniref:Choline-sulfatase n=1 Tax=Saccharicrinis fermentans DSM 9555 = JCM 21142 TaxID=869213 RepID=W7YI27_9BACT|nr:sulfatase [Saccharicrinis fermentans]GAF02204.1 choline-sulfatase [Saccharicrinis fermentans DSM 9555 = JCM 21142]